MIASSHRLNELKGLAEDNVDDAVNASMETQPETHVMIFALNPHLIRRYFKNKITTRQAPRIKFPKRGYLDDNFIQEMKADPRRKTQSYEIQLDEKLATLKRKTTSLQQLMEEIANIGDQGDVQYLQSIDQKTQEIQQISDRFDGLTSLI